MSFSKRSENAQVCYTKPLDSLKNWNDHFFWVDASVLPLAIPWHINKTLKKDPPPLPTEYNADVCDYLATNPAPFKKFLEPFLCFVGTSRYYTLDEEMDLFAFIHHADPTKVKIGEREVREGEVPLLELNQGRVVPLAGVNDQGGVAAQGVGDDNVNEGSDDVAAADHAEQSGPFRLREDHGTFGDAGVSTVRKSLAALQDLLDKSTLAAEIGVTAAATVPFVTSSMTLTPEHEGGPNVPDPAVLTTTLHYGRGGTTSRSLLETDPITDSFLRSLDMDSETLHQIYVPKWDVLNESALDESNTCRSLVDQLAPLMFFSQLSAIEYNQLFTEFNVGAARQTCLARLSLREAEAAEAIHLRGQIANVEAAEAARAGELESLKEQNVALEGRVTALESAVVAKDFEVAKLTQELSSLQPSCDDLSIKASILECEKDKLVDQAVRDVQVKVLSDRIAELDANLMGMALHLDEEFYPRYLTTIAGRSLAEVAAHNPAAEADYVDALNALHAVEFLLLAQLPSHKDASIYDLMDLLRLEGTPADILKLSLLQPSPEQLMLPIHRLGDQANAASRQLSISDTLVPLVESLSAENLVGEASTSGVPVTATTTALSTTFVQDSTIPLVSVVNHEASGAGSSTVVPPSSEIVFEKELETTPEHTMAS
ncbi:hypothetical protein Tco_0138437 [Tanacetum coccineum]